MSNEIQIHTDLWRLLLKYCVLFLSVKLGYIQIRRRMWGFTPIWSNTDFIRNQAEEGAAGFPAEEQTAIAQPWRARKPKHWLPLRCKHQKGSNS